MLDHKSANLKSTGDDWAPQQINMRSKSASSTSDNCSRGMPDRRMNMFEVSFDYIVGLYWRVAAVCFCVDINEC